MMPATEVNLQPVNECVQERVMSKPVEIEWILIKDAAAIMGLHIESVRRLCRQNKIRCRQLIKGVSAWEVSKEDAENYERDYGGRPHETDL